MNHPRKCHDCGNVAEHADNIVPEVLCKLCGSQDTRAVRDKSQQPDADDDERERIRAAMTACNDAMTEFVKRLREKFHDEILIEVLFISVVGLVMATVERERIDLDKSRLDAISDALLTELQDRIDEVFYREIESRN